MTTSKSKTRKPFRWTLVALPLALTVLLWDYSQREWRADNSEVQGTQHPVGNPQPLEELEDSPNRVPQVAAVATKDHSMPAWTEPINSNRSRLRVLDPAGNPMAVPSVSLVSKPKEKWRPKSHLLPGRKRSSTDGLAEEQPGEFSFDKNWGGYPQLPDGLGCVSVDMEAREGIWQATVVASPTKELVVHVVDTNGDPIANTNIYTNIEAYDSPIPELQRGRSWHLGSESKDLKLTIFKGTRMSVRAYAPGFGPQMVADAWNAESPLDLVLKEYKPGGEFITLNGTVLLWTGQPAHGANVGFGRNSTYCDKRGAFTIKVASYLDPQTFNTYLRPNPTAKSLAQYGEFDLNFVGHREGDTWTANVRMPEPLAPYQIIVVNENGSSVVNRRVTLLSGSKVGNIAYFAEYFRDHMSDAVLKTDEEGYLEFPRLADREITIAIAQEPGLLGCEVITIHGQSTQRIVMPKRRTTELRGRIVDRLGQPLEDHSLYIDFAPLDGNNYHDYWSAGPIPLQSDGSFGPVSISAEVDNVLTVHSQLKSQTQDEFMLSEFDLTQPLNLVSTAAVPIEIEWRGERSGKLQFLDANGTPSAINFQMGGTGFHDHAIHTNQYAPGLRVFVDANVVEVGLNVDSKLIATQPVTFEKGKIPRIQMVQ